MVLVWKASSSNLYQDYAINRAHFFGVLFIFFGLWMIVTNRSYDPEDKPPYWWSIGGLILIALAAVITW